MSGHVTAIIRGFVMAMGITACLDQPVTSDLQQDERIEVTGCRPGFLQVGDECVDPWPGGTPPLPPPGERDGGGPRGPGGGGGGGGGGPGRTMDPEPDRNKDRRSCWDWCSWDWRQCVKECKHRFQYPDWYKRNQCLSYCDQKVNECKADCNTRFPERPLVTMEPSP